MPQISARIWAVIHSARTGSAGTGGTGAVAKPAQHAKELLAKAAALEIGIGEMVDPLPGNVGAREAGSPLLRPHASRAARGSCRRAGRAKWVFAVER